MPTGGPASETKGSFPIVESPGPVSASAGASSSSAPSTPTRALQDYNPKLASPPSRSALDAVGRLFAHRRDPADIIPGLLASAQALHAQDPGELRRLTSKLVQRMGGSQRLDGRLCNNFVEAACEALRAGELGAAAFQGLAFGLVEGIGGFALSGENARVVLLALQACHEPAKPEPARLVLDVLGLALAAQADPAPRASVAPLVENLFTTASLGLLFDPGKALHQHDTRMARAELQARQRCVELRAALQEAPELPGVIDRLAGALVQLGLDRAAVGKEVVAMLRHEAADHIERWPAAAKTQFMASTRALRRRLEGTPASPASPPKYD